MLRDGSTEEQQEQSKQLLAKYKNNVLAQQHLIKRDYCMFQAI
jgi:hypothetical protein